MRVCINLFLSLTVTVFFKLALASEIPKLPTEASGFVKVKEVSNKGFSQIVYARENEAISVIYNFSEGYNFKNVLMSEVKNLQRMQNLVSGDIKYFPPKKLKSMGSHFDAVLFATFSEKEKNRFDITALSNKENELIKIRFTGLNSSNLSDDFHNAMIISEAFLINLIRSTGF